MAKKYDRLNLRLPFGTVRLLKMKALDKGMPLWKFILKKTKISLDT